MAENELNIYQKLAKLRKQVEVISKNKAGYGYKYVSEDEILAKLTGLMDKYELSLVPRITPGTVVVTPYYYEKTKVKNGSAYEEKNNEVLVQGDMVYTWVNNVNPEERIEVNWAFVGQQTDASQSLGSGLTYASRYFLLKYFGIATPEDDPDSWRSKQKEAEAAEDRAIAQELIGELDLEVRSYLAANPEKNEEVGDFIGKYVKSKNYKQIQESTLAAKLLSDFKEKYLKEGK